MLAIRRMLGVAVVRSALVTALGPTRGSWRGRQQCAWIVSFFDSDVNADDKSNTYYVRAVRGGS